MNIVRLVIVAEGNAAPWVHGCALGRCCAGVDVMGDDFWCRHLVAMRGAEERTDGTALERLRRAARGIVIEAIMLNVCEVVIQKFGFAQWRCSTVWKVEDSGFGNMTLDYSAAKGERAFLRQPITYDAFDFHRTAIKSLTEDEDI
jgi:hypothetical protein